MDVEPTRYDTIHRRDGSTYTRRARSRALDRGQHGFAGYRQGCRCRRCVRSFREYHQRRRHRQQRERAGVVNRRVPASPVAVHLLELYRAGWSVRKLACEVGCSESTLWRITRLHRRGKRARCWSTISAAVLGVIVTPPARRRGDELDVDAMRARGYSHRFVRAG